MMRIPLVSSPFPCSLRLLLVILSAYFLFVGRRTVLGQQPSSVDECQLQVKPGSHCQPYLNCTGLTCINSTLLGDKAVSFTIDKCTDPLQYHITVSDTVSRELLTHLLYSNSTDHTTYTDNDSGLLTMLGRNASHAHIMISFNINHSSGGNMDPKPIVPYTVVPLNAGECMCESVTRIKDNGELPIENNCDTDDQCVGIECDLTIEGVDYLVDTQVYPCDTPPGFLFLVKNKASNEAVYDEYFDTSKNTTLFGFPFNVEVKQLKYSMIVHGVLIVQQQRFDLIPETQIILDKEKCPMVATLHTVAPTSTESTSTKPHTAKPTPTNTPTGISPQTCDRLKDLASQPPEDIGKCDTNKACDTITCKTFNDYIFEFTVLPCDSPPSIHVVIIDDEGEVVYDGVVTNRTEIPLGPFDRSLILYVDDEPGFMNVKATIDFDPFGEIPFFPETSIPIDDCQCVQKDEYLPSSCLLSSTMTNSNLPTPPLPSKSGFFESVVGTAVMSVVAFIVVLIVVLLVTVMVVVCVLRIRKKSSGYSFQRMRMGNIQEDQDELIT